MNKKNKNKKIISKKIIIGILVILVLIVVLKFTLFSQKTNKTIGKQTSTEVIDNTDKENTETKDEINQTQNNDSEEQKNIKKIALLQKNRKK